jgi:hypothetical protein
MKNLFKELLEYFDAYKKSIDWFYTLILFIIFAIGSQLNGFSLFNFCMVVVFFIVLTIGAYTNKLLHKKKN